MQKLVLAAAATARAHRDAVRLLLQGVEDASYANDGALQEFLADPVNHDSICEVHAFTHASEAFLHPIRHASVRAVAHEVLGSPNRDRDVKMYEGISSEVRERVNETCPCRGCVNSRTQAMKTVSACLRKIQDKAKEEK